MAVTEINREWFCTAGEFKKGVGCMVTEYLNGEKYNSKCYKDCSCRHRKHPTPEQFKEEYGREWKGAVYVNFYYAPHEEWTGWVAHNYKDKIMGLYDKVLIVCACTPFGPPPKDWRPNS